ncbi:MAG: acyl-CoA dehydrogenase family protein [Alphaproteobacteria bacterium]|nr:acyl-CoA dehydrogenase family protein [Alphaproteobacteria bacterium]
MLTEKQTMIRDTVRKFAQKHLAPSAAERDRKHTFPSEAIAEMSKLGLMGMMVPDEFGGAGLDYASFATAITEIAAADGACSTIVSVHNTLVCIPLLKYGTPDQQAQFLAPLARGEYLGAFCLSEPDAGSDAASLKTTAHRQGDHYVLNGTKQFITSGKSADIAVVFAITDPTAAKKGISAFIVPTKTPGYEVARIEETFGQRSSDHCQIVFDSCEVPADHMLGAEGAGLRIALGNLEGGRIGVAAQSLGMARSAYEMALAYAKERHTFGKPIFEHQAIAFQLAEMATGLHAAELMIWRAATMRDAGEPCLKEASMAKLFTTEMAEKVCSSAIQIFGGYGYLTDYPVERIYRDVRVCKIYEGTSEIQRLIISREIAAA